MRGNQKNKNYTVEQSPGFFYAIGLLTTDGCLSKDGRHIIFVSKDLSLIKTFKKCLNIPNINIGQRKSTFTGKKNYYHVQFSNTKLYKYLLAIGLRPNKSKTLDRLEIPDNYFFDFLRGHFDGDGSCFSYWDERWSNSFMFYTHFISASPAHLQWLREKISSLLNTRGSINRLLDIWSLQYAKKDSQALWRKMYYQCNLPCLARKRQKIQNILRTQAQVMELVDMQA